MPHTVIILFAPAAASISVIVSDFRQRRVSVVWLVAVFTASFAAATHTESCMSALSHLLSCTIVVAMLMLCLWGYTKLRYGRSASLADSFGAGDWCYMLSLCPLFPPTDMLKLLIAAAVTATAWHTAVDRGRRSTVPFAGFTALTFICITVIRYSALWLS